NYANIPTNSWMALTNRQSLAGNSFEIHHSMVTIRNTPATSNPAGGLDYTVVNLNPAVGAGNASTSKAFNNIFSVDNATPQNYLGLTNQAANIKNNAYRNFDASTAERGHSNDAGAVTLANTPTFGVDDAQLRNAGTTDVLYSHDINGKRRTVATPDLGPVDFTSPV
ncbi:MAG: hypothetical protein AB7G28_22685, partial [Pirellulales bacterium]